MMKETSTLKIDQIIFDNVENEMDPEGIKKILEKKTVWCFIYPNEEILDEEWKMMLAEGKYRGEYKLDWCKFQVYSWN